MKKIFTAMMTVAAMVTATAAMAGNVVTETYPIKSSYTAISVTNMIEVVLLDAPKNSIRVETDERLMPYLQIVVKNGVLVLNFDDQREVERLRKRNLILPTHVSMFRHVASIHLQRRVCLSLRPICRSQPAR